MLLKILTHKDPALRIKSKKIKKEAIDSILRQQISDMKDTMLYYKGIGLAAIQVGIPKQVILFKDPNNKVHCLINPKIIQSSEEIQTNSEGCLSVPNLIGNVTRPVEIYVRGMDEKGKLIFFKAKNYMAHIIAHEIDHLNGILFTDIAIDTNVIENK